MRLIDADALKKDLKDNYIYYGETELLNDFYKAFDEQPTVQAIPIEELQEIRQEIEEAKEIMNDIMGDSHYSIRMNELRTIIDKHIKEIEGSDTE